MIRAYIHDNFFGPSIAVSLVRHFESERPPLVPPQLLRFTARGEGDEQHLLETWQEIPDLAGSEPTLRLGHDAAIALMIGLTGHFQGVDDQRMLRQDYTAERKRVDDLVGILGDVARRKFG